MPWVGVYNAIAHTIAPENYGELSDDKQIASAAQTFALLDEEDERVESK